MLTFFAGAPSLYKTIQNELQAYHFVCLSISPSICLSIFVNIKLTFMSSPTSGKESLDSSMVTSIFIQINIIFSYINVQ